MTTRPALPAPFVRTVRSTFGGDGARWLRRLPALLAEAERRWSLVLGPPFPGLSYNYAAPARRADGLAVVLKAGVPREELHTEIAALELFAGRGCVPLLAADGDEGLLLLARLEPGVMLSTVADDEAATRIGAAVARRLWRPAPDDHPFPAVADWAAGLARLRARYGGGTGPLPAALVDRAEGLFRELLAGGPAPRLLHGDLHHFNILSAGETWAAIDPKGLVGDPGYDLGAFLYNPLPGFAARPALARLLARRVAVLAEALGYEWRRLAAWGAAQAVLSAAWSVEDGTGDGTDTLPVAAVLAGWV